MTIGYSDLMNFFRPPLVQPIPYHGVNLLSANFRLGGQQSVDFGRNLYSWQFNQLEAHLGDFLRGWGIFRKLWPDLPPVIWAHFAAGQRASCDLFELYRQLFTTCFLAVTNVSEVGVGGATARGKGSAFGRRDIS